MTEAKADIITLPINDQIQGLDAHDFLERDYPEREYLLNPWLQRQGLTMLYAYRGVGKTHAALGIAWAVATGSSYLKWVAGSAKRVLFLDGEMAAKDLQSRILALAGKGIETLQRGHFTVVTPDELDKPLNLSTEDGQVRIEPLCQAHDLIVVDNIATLTSAGIDNEGDAWPMVQQWALNQRRAGKSVLFIHHANKSGGQRGTSSREDVLDTVISLKRPAGYVASEGARFEIEFTKHRGFGGSDAEPFEAQLHDDGSNATWTFKEADRVVEDKVAFLKSQGDSIRLIAQKLNLSKSSVQRKVDKLEALGVLDRSAN